MTPLLSSIIKVNCPDGPRYILKHPEKAFAIHFPEWNGRVKALVNFFSGSKAQVDPKIFKKTKSIVKNLTENYAALQAHYQAAYLGWCGNPCSKEAEKAYNDAKALICEKEFAIRKLESITSKIAHEVKTRLSKTKKKKGSTKKTKEKIAYRDSASSARGRFAMPPPTRERIPVSETVFGNIEELVSKLKI